MAKPVAVAGAGLAGAVLAREIADNSDQQVVVFEERAHVGGHCHSEWDEATGIMLHVHGAHVFHTGWVDVWDYVNRFDRFVPLEVRVKAVTERGVFSLPINLLTLNQFFGRVMNPAQAQKFLQTVGDPTIEEPRSFEDYALRHIGRELYENFLLGYTMKQWGVHPSALPASVLRRLPIRHNYDDRYLDDPYQGVPLSGYTRLIERILDHPQISVQLNQRFGRECRDEFRHLFYSGPLDSYFGETFGRLGYRSLRFERIDAVGDFQGGPLLTYCDPAVPYTRVLEHKHLSPWEEHAATVVFREYSFATGPGQTPYYPLRLVGDEQLFHAYADLAACEEGVTFIGRLGTYRYLDMHVVVAESIDLARRFLQGEDTSFAVFSRPSP